MIHKGAEEAREPTLKLSGHRRGRRLDPYHPSGPASRCASSSERLGGPERADIPPAGARFRSRPPGSRHRQNYGGRKKRMGPLGLSERAARLHGYDQMIAARALRAQGLAPPTQGRSVHAGVSKQVDGLTSATNPAQLHIDTPDFASLPPIALRAADGSGVLFGALAGVTGRNTRLWNRALFHRASPDRISRTSPSPAPSWRRRDRTCPFTIMTDRKTVLLYDPFSRP